MDVTGQTLKEFFFLFLNRHLGRFSLLSKISVKKKMSCPTVIFFEGPPLSASLSGNGGFGPPKIFFFLSKHRPSGPMLSISQNVRPSVCLFVRLCVHF